MKAFTICKGNGKKDFCFPPEGDLAYIVTPYWGSLDTRTASTTARVTEIDMTIPEYVQAHLDSVRKACQTDKLSIDLETAIADDALELLRLADMFEIDAVVRIKRNRLVAE